jgi:hypothetical protein
MRSRFNHEGALDHHADNEHDLLRRADEALERRRQMDHAAKAAEQAATGGITSTLRSHMPSPLGTASSGVAATTPKMPHEEIAERFAVRPVALPSINSQFAWPTRTSTLTTGNTQANSRKR